MKLIGKRTTLYGLFNGKPDENCKDFDDSELFEEKMYKSILLKSLKIYFIEKDRLLGLESFFVNYITGEKKTSGYHGGEILSKDIKIQEITMEYNEYIKSFDIEFDKDFEKIIYIHILTNRGKEIKFGEYNEKKTTIVRDNEKEYMIQFFYGGYDKTKIMNIGYVYLDIKDFYFYAIIPILKLKYKLKHDEEFRKKLEINYKELLKDNLPMHYLYRACSLPEAIFAKILKYC
jgi:hypothetical protein